MTMHIEPSRPTPPVTKAVVPVGGLGTRFLPATKATPKEMLPVVDKPAIQYVVEEAVAAGCDDLLLVTGPSKRPIEDHFDRVASLEAALRERGDTARLAEVRASTELADIHYVRQGQALGLGHAVLRAARHVGDQPFAVLLGDDIIDQRDPVLPAMLQVRARYGGSVICLMEVDPEEICTYGCASVTGQVDHDVLLVDDLVEKPEPGTAPSNLAVIGRYVLDPRVFQLLRSTRPGRGGEIQLTDALKTLTTLPADDGGGVRGVVFHGRRYDTGDKLSYLKSIVQLACDRPDLGPRFSQWLVQFAGQLAER